MEAIIEPIEISFPLPKAPHAVLHGHLTFDNGYSMVHLTTSELGDSSGSLAPLGSFVYAMPPVREDRVTKRIWVISVADEKL